MEEVQHISEIMLEICHYPSPWELLSLYTTCRSIKGVLDDNQRVWRLARKRLMPPVPDPTLPAHLFGFSRSWSEVSYAKYVFGNTKCTFCGDDIDEPWVSASFSLRLFPCAKKTCKARLDNETQTLAGFSLAGFTNEVEHMKFSQSYTPYLEFTGHQSRQGEDLRRYAASQFDNVEWKVALEILRGGKQSAASAKERKMDGLKLVLHITIQRSWLHAYMQTAEALSSWQEEYLSSIEWSDVVNWNVEIAQGFVKEDRMKYAKVERSSTFKGFMLSLSRMQTSLMPSDWEFIKKEISREMLDKQHGITTFPIPKDWKQPVVCPLCPRAHQHDTPRLFAGSRSLLDHAMLKHHGVDRASLVKDA